MSDKKARETDGKGIIGLAKESAAQDRSFGAGQVFSMVTGLGIGIGAWNLAQKNEGFRKVFNFPAEVITNILHKFTGIERRTLDVGVRELYDVIMTSPFMVLVEFLRNKVADRMGHPPHGHGHGH